MAGLVALGVVGVHRVGVVGRDARRGGERAEEIVAGATAWRGRAARGRARGAVRGAGRARRPDLLVVEEDDHDDARRRRPTRPATSWRPSTTPGCRAGRWRAATRRRPAPRRPARRTGTAPTTPAASIAAASASHSANSPVVDVPLPQTGCRCCCLSSIRPRSLTSRSRWIASCGTRATGRRTSTSCDEPSAQHDPPGDAEVAVEPRVEQHAAVDLDAELPPADSRRCRGAA